MWYQHPITFAIAAILVVIALAVAFFVARAQRNTTRRRQVREKILYALDQTKPRGTPLTELGQYLQATGMFVPTQFLYDIMDELTRAELVETYVPHQGGNTHYRIKTRTPRLIPK